MCKSKKSIFFLTLVLIFLLGISSSAADIKEIEVWSWNIAASALEDRVESFEEMYPNVKINVKDIGRLDVYDRLTIGLASNSGLPDVVTIESDRLPNYFANFPNGFVDLSKYGANEYIDQFDSSKWAQAKLDNKIVAMPWDSGPAGIFYRRDYFDEAGIDVNDIETWEDFIDAGVKLKEATNDEVKMLPFNYSNDDDFYRMLLNQAGTFYFNEKGEITINSEEAVAALNVLKKMKESNISLNVTGWNDYVNATVNSRVATVPYGVWYGGTIMDQAPDQAKKWGVFKLPSFEKGGNQAANLGGSNLAVTSQSENPEIAYKFVEYVLADTENQISMYQDYGLFPAFLPAYKHDYFNEENKYFDMNISELFASTISNIPGAYYTKDYARARQHVINAQSSVLTGDADPKDALEEAAERIKNTTGRTIAK